MTPNQFPGLKTSTSEKDLEPPALSSPRYSLIQAAIIFHSLPVLLPPDLSAPCDQRIPAQTSRALHYPRITYKGLGMVSKAHYHLASASFSLASSLITAPPTHALQPWCLTKGSPKAFSFSRLWAFVHSVPLPDVLLSITPFSGYLLLICLISEV